MAAGRALKYYDGVTMKSSGFTSPEPVSALLTAAVPELAHRMLEERIRREWPGTVGRALAQRSRPGELRQSTLQITADNSPWLQELAIRSDEILTALRGRYGGAVTALRFSLGAQPPASPRGSRRLPAAAPRLTAEEEREIEALAASLPDADLAESVRRLLTKDRLARRSGGFDPGASGPPPAEGSARAEEDNC
jgi:hypothetical protein